MWAFEKFSSSKLLWLTGRLSFMNSKTPHDTATAGHDTTQRWHNKSHMIWHVTYDTNTTNTTNVQAIRLICSNSIWETLYHRCIYRWINEWLMTVLSIHFLLWIFICMTTLFLSKWNPKSVNCFIKTLKKNEWNKIKTTPHICALHPPLDLSSIQFYSILYCP
jgi:hypothetical protein